MPGGSETLPDSEKSGFIAWLPAAARPYAQLARFDRPIGAWLLFWPGAWAVALSGQFFERWRLLLWLGLGAVLMRGAGCVYNDIVDRDLDRHVARTASRPLASGRVGVKSAWLWLATLCLGGLIVLFQLRPAAQIVATASLLLVAAYPYMKRLTWWPQAWLGLVFSWAALVGAVEVEGTLTLPARLLYLGSIFWVIGYDTIYALQDIEDDALTGVKSSARALGGHARLGIGICYGLAVMFWMLALWSLRPQLIALFALAPTACHLAWQLIRLDQANPISALDRFRSNRFTGLITCLGFIAVGTSNS